MNCLNFIIYVPVIFLTLVAVIICVVLLKRDSFDTVIYALFIVMSWFFISNMWVYAISEKPLFTEYRTYNVVQQYENVYYQEYFDNDILVKIEHGNEVVDVLVNENDFMVVRENTEKDAFVEIKSYKDLSGVDKVILHIPDEEILADPKQDKTAEKNNLSEHLEFCPECGTKSDENWSFCGNCGEKIRN